MNDVSMFAATKSGSERVRARNAAFVLIGHTSTCEQALANCAAAAVRVGPAAMILAIIGS